MAPSHPISGKQVAVFRIKVKPSTRDGGKPYATFNVYLRGVWIVGWRLIGGYIKPPQMSYKDKQGRAVWRNTVYLDPQTALDLFNELMNHAEVKVAFGKGVPEPRFTEEVRISSEVRQVLEGVL